MKNSRKKQFALLAMTAFLLLTACGGKGASSAPAADTGAGMIRQDMYAEPEEMASAEMGAGENTAEVSAISAVTSSSGEIQPADTERKLIRTVSMNLETTEFDTLVEHINKKVTELNGYIENSNISGSSIRYGGEKNRRSAQITARIPADGLPAFITEVESNGNVINKQESVEDVTLSYADVESRKKTLEVEQERLWTLLEKADTTEAIITLESRLSEIRYQLESYESQLRLMANQVSYSTVNLYVEEVSLFTPTAKEGVGERIRRGFVENLERVGNAFTNLLVWLISSSPVIVLCLAFLFIIWLTVRKYEKRKKTGAENGEEQKGKK